MTGSSATSTRSCAFFARQHHNLCKKFIRDYNIAQRFAQLLSCKQKHLQLGAFFATIQGYTIC